MVVTAGDRDTTRGEDAQLLGLLARPKDRLTRAIATTHESTAQAGSLLLWQIV
jgi:hypothetical protein